jgi:CubicO group peptidase (beta-lactamase class C family)
MIAHASHAAPLPCNSKQQCVNMLIDGPTRRQFVYSLSAFSAGTVAPEFRDFYVATLESNGVVGSTFLLIRDNAPPVTQFYGYSNLTNKTPIDWNTCYHWASITKTFTAIAIMQFVTAAVFASIMRSAPTCRSCGKSTIHTARSSRSLFVTC